MREGSKVLFAEEQEEGIVMTEEVVLVCISSTIAVKRFLSFTFIVKID